MKNDIYWLWLVLKKGIGAVTVKELTERFGCTPRGLYERDDFSEDPEMSRKLALLLSDKSLDAAKRTAERVYGLGGEIITLEDDEYPELLRHISDPPPVLYAKGRAELLRGRLTVGMVGTRNCNDYGLDAAKYICAGLAEAGAVTVSGMAAGIDSAAAAASIRHGGLTAAVMGTGLDIIYPHGNERLFEEITEHGAVFTEYPPGTEPYKSNFPRRNRLIAGMSRGLTVVQAPLKSGALITASQALDEGRDVFAVPGSIFDIRHEGANRLIKDGAKPVFSALDILEEYRYLFAPSAAENMRELRKPAAAYTARETQKPASAAEGLTDGQKRALTADLSGNELKAAKLLFGGAAHIDTIARELGITASEAGTLMLMLEMKGTVKRSGGDNFVLNDSIVV